MRFIPIEEFERPVTQPRFIPIEEFEPSVRAPEEFPPGIAGAGPMALPSDFSIPVEAPPVAGLQPVKETEPILPAEASISSFVKGPSYRDRREALDDAVNLIEEGYAPKQVFDGFKALGISEQEIMLHGQQRGSAMFQPQPVPPGEVTPVAPSDRMVAGEPDQADRQLRETFPLSPLRLIPLQQTADTFKRAGTSLSDQATSLLLQSGAIDPDGAAQLIRRNARARSAAAPNQDIQEGMQAIGEAETFGQAAEAMLKNPKATMSMLVDSLLVSAPGLAATLAIAPAGLVARAGMAGVTSGGMEYAAVMTDVLQDRKVDLTNAAEVAKALQNPEILAEMKDKGAKRGLIIGGFDALSMGLAGRFLRPANELISAGKLTGAAAKKATVAAWSKELALQMGAGGGGEFVAQKATGEDKPAAVLLEALAEGVAAPVDVYGALSEARAREAVARVAPTPPVAGRIEPTLPEVIPEAPGRVEPTIETEPTVEGRPEPTLPAEEEPVVLRPTRRGPPVEETVEDVPAIPGMPSIEEPSYVFTPIEAGVTPVAPAVEEPPVPEGFVRVYHSGSAGEGDFGRWVSTSKRYASDYRKDLPLFYTDIQADDPRVNNPDYPDTQGVKQGFVFNFELTPQEAANLREIPREPTVAPVTPTPAAAATPETPTVPPVAVPRVPEPKAPQLEAQGLATVEVPLDQLKLSKEVPQFKLGATAKGVVEPLGGKFERTGVAPIQVWRRLDGSLEVISGRHRLDLAQRSGEKTIPAQIHDEAQGFTRDHAAILDAELNIRDGQGKAKDYVNYFKASGIDRETAESRGLLARATGKRAFTIATQGSDELLAALRSDSISEEAAFYIALNAPNDSRIQAVGINAMNNGKTMNMAVNTMQAVQALAGEQGVTVDMFGLDDSGIREAEAMAKIAARKQRELQTRLSAITGASKNPAVAKAEGIDIKDPAAVKRRIEELRQQKAAWENWQLNPELVAEVRAEREKERGGETRDMFEPDVEAEPKTGDVVLTIPAPDNMETRVFKTSDGYGTGLFDKDSGNFVDGSITRFKGDDARAKAEKKAQEVAKEATPEDQADTPENPIEFMENNGFERVPQDSPDQYKDAGGNKYFTMRRGPVRIALEPNEALFVNERGAVIRARDIGDYTIAAILVDQDARGTGEAKRTLELVSAAADQFDAKLYLEPVPLMDKPMSKERLINLYKSFGFVQATPSSDKVLVREPGAKSEAPAVAPIVDRFASKVQTEGQTSEAFEDADGVQVRTTTSKWQGTTSRANFDELIKYAVASPQKQGRKYSIVLADTPDKSSILTFTTRGYTPTQQRVEVVMQLQSSERGEAAPVDPIARVWSGLKTSEMPEFNELSSDAQATVQSLVEQGQLTPDVAREIAEDDEINRASPLRETIKAKVGVNKARVAKILSQQLYGVTAEMPKVTLKELFQNAFDATKEAVEKGQIQQGNISIVFNESDRSIEVIDNGMGMPSSVMGKEFLEIAGSKKGTARSSGGFGIAKVQFLYGNKQLEVISLRDGVLSKMVTTGDAVHAALKGSGPAPNIEITQDPDAIQQAIERYFPEGHGTSVKVTVPDVYQDTDTRQTVALPFDTWWLSKDPSLRLSPLFTDVNVQVAMLDQSSKRDNLFDNRWRFDDVEIGSKFPTDSYAPVSSVKFPWGSAVVYTSTKPTGTHKNFNVLSNGLWQFTEQLGAGPFKPLPRSFYIDVIPSKAAGELGYPFELNRQGFTKAAEQDIDAIKKYLKILYNQTNLAEDVKDFGTVQYINNNGTVTTPAELKPSIPSSSTPTLPTIKPTDKVEIKDGRMSVNGKVLPEISESEMKDVKIDVDALTIDQGEIDANKILFHNNAENKNTKDSLYKMAVDKFGEERVNKYFYGVGKTFLRLRNALVSVDPTYADMAQEGIGISLDTKYLGVNIRVPFKGMFINPAYAKISNTPAQVAVAMMGTMQHEMAHFKQRNHGGEFASEMQRINALLDTHPSFDIFALKKYFIAHIKENEDIFNFLKTEFDSGNLQPIGKRFEDASYEQIRDDGDSGAVEGAGRGRERRPRVSEGTGEGVEAARESTEPTGVSGRPEGQRGRGADEAGRVEPADQAERERVDELLDEFNRPKVTGRELETVKSRLMPSTSSIRSTFREMIDNPSQAANMIFGPLNRGIAQARNYLFFSGAGLEEADAKRYANQVRTANDEATATLALDNMLHGNGIAVQFMIQGGLRYNPETKRIEAHQADGSMLDVYINERALKNKLGDERGAMLIQGYLEAKRSKSIRDEMAQLAEEIEVQKESLDDARARLRELQKQGAADITIGQQQSVVDGLAQQYNETKEQLDNIVQINEEKVLMSEEEIEAFINQDAAYPELRNIMDAWTATNRRLLGMMRQVRMISAKRYKRLMSIKDYVPWQRVQDDDVDIHYVGNPRSATNISKERAFKKGKVESAVDYIPDNMTDNIIRLTQSVLRQYAALRIVDEYATRDPETGKIKTFAKVDKNKGRFDYISDGRRVVVEVKDPLIAEAVYGRDSVDLRAPEAIAAATNFMRRAITIDPFFQMSQVIKDAPTAAIVTGVRNPAALMGSVMTSFVKTVVNADPVADILRANGIGGFQAITRTPEAAIKRKKGLVNRSVGAATLEIMDHIGDASDFAARIAAYKRTIAETKSDQMPNGDKALAIQRAANVINFNRLGSHRIVRSIVTYVNFANAYLQSIDTLFTALTARGARGRDTKKALGIMAATVAQLTALTLAYSWLVGGDDEYEKLDDGTKVRNFFIPKSITGTDSGILIPINTSAAFIFKAMPELTYNMFVSQATKTPMDAARYKKAVSEAAADALLGPEPVPTVIRPIVEIAMNRSFFTERSLTPRGTETLEKFQQFTDQTSELGKLLGQAGYLSPIEWDHLIRGTTGIAGMMAQYGSNMIGEYLSVRPESTAKQLPGVGRFIAPEVGRGPEALFYDLHERVRKATSTYKDLEATGQYEKAEKFDAEKNLLIDLSREMNRTEAKLKKINSEIRMLSRGREEGTAKERRREITELQRDKQELLEGIEMLRKEAGL